MNDVALREVKVSDWDFWRYLHHVAERATIERQFGPWDERLQDEFAWKTFFEETQGERRIIQVDGWDAGFWQVIPQDEVLFLNQIVLLPAAQNRGIGRRLIMELQQRGRDKGKAVTLQTLLQNTAKQLYEKLGFVVTGQSPTHWQMRWDN